MGLCVTLVRSEASLKIQVNSPMRLRLKIRHGDKQTWPRHEIQRLLDEHEVLSRSFGVSQSSFNSGTDPVVQDLTAMLTCKDKIDEELEAEEAQIASLKDQGSECFNKLMARNVELREELKTLQLEKKHFLQIRSQLEMELHANRKDICNLTTKCTETFNVRGKIKEKLKTLGDHNTKDTAQYIKESSDLERELCHQSCVQDFLDIKTIGCNNLNSGRRKVEKGKTLESNELGLEDFEDVINKTLRETGDSDLDKLIRNFIQREEQNYTLLNFVNYQHSETEVIRKHITQICYGSLVTCDQLDSSDRDQDENIKAYLRMVEDQVNELFALQSYLHLQERPGEWDIDSLSTIAGQLLGIRPRPADLTIAAAIPAPVKREEADLVASVLLEAKEPVSREGLQTLANKRVQRKKDTGVMFPSGAAP
ncbi:Coiled-coil domain-containing protein 114 [Collichthys lucidus]|uniref:Coiled-coil domain-containing protein 114 n=1 Tax=Collichthys lucidus TaxID=240159 RepID=A0A4U5US28_COLLU|nr:Coiled-coil domain-containing protein 114 [Collichthys lucidus]